MSTPIAAGAASPFACWRADHAGLRVPDFAAAVAWYCGTLDFRLLASLPLGEKTLAFLAPAADESFRIELIAGPGCSPRPPFEQLPDTHAQGGWHHLCFRVDDVDVAVAALRCRDVRIVSAPREVAALGVKFAFIADPWGNLLELMQPLA
ncbi:VOC family protein [Massilia sp. PWRC2]|uniref:VOC family protein n=1 Tax=Massilia sp. PWRC2 TaxID=2804626 RepID=UPI003CF73383